ncbi:MAG TPA: TonB-dependent receptor, partial [Candidatus Polarisedimenticolaceae bacterium]|nr:TonB-dependent receptor [Candidatus Polarisedimenticolaceae bacterium]
MRRPIPVTALSTFILVTATSEVSLALAQDETTPYDETVVVTSTRLEDKPAPKSDVPAHVTVVDRERIEASGARNLQDLLVEEAGIALIDQVGNDVQKTLDLRGFAGGKGVAVFLDGARLNDPRNNAVALEQVPLDAVERVEITRGPAAALAGGGAEAGVVRIITRRGTTPAASVSVSGGTWNTQAYDGTYGGRFGRFDVFGSGSYDTTDGFRPNAGGRQARFYASGGVDVGGERHLSLSLFSSDLDYGNPGALSLAEFESDPQQNVYNRLDFTDSVDRQASLTFQGPVGAGFSVAAHVAFRDDRASTLSTGRSASVFGGFFLDAEGSAWSGTGQATREIGGHRLAFGAEALDGDTDSTGFFTSPSSPGTYDPSAPASRNTAGVTSAGVFAQDAWSISPRWNLTGGVRADRSRVGYDESIPGTVPSDERTFSEVSLRAGVTARPTDAAEIYVSYADAFLPPTPEQLFAFPFFGSNPELKPEDAHAYELGARVHGSAYSIDAALFLTDTRNEIIFDPTPTPSDPFGTNVNAAATRRLGAELAARGRLGARVSAFANAAYTDATFTAGPDDGSDVPLVPKVRVAAGLDAALPRGFGLRIDGLHVGSQVLDNDAGNVRSRLEAYTVANVR